MVVPAPEYPVSSQVRGPSDGDTIQSELATARVDIENVATQTKHNADSNPQDGIEAARGGKEKQAQDDGKDYLPGEEEDSGRVADANMRQIAIDEDATESDSEFGVAREKEDVEMTSCENTASQQEEEIQEQEVQEQAARNTRPPKHKLSEEEGVGAASLESSDQKKLKTATPRNL
jgi:hypothetical protein